MYENQASVLTRDEFAKKDWRETAMEESDGRFLGGKPGSKWVDRLSERPQNPRQQRVPHS